MSGYIHCACRDCMEITIGTIRKGGDFCDDCIEHGCEVDTECKSPHSYGGDYYDNPQTDDDFIQLAMDVHGNAIRDNSRAEKIEIGKRYHETGK